MKQCLKFFVFCKLLYFWKTEIVKIYSFHSFWYSKQKKISTCLKKVKTRCKKRFRKKHKKKVEIRFLVFVLFPKKVKLIKLLKTKYKTKKQKKQTLFL